MAFDELRLAVYPGTGVVGRLEGVVLHVTGRDSAGSGAQRLLEICRNRDTALAGLKAVVEAREPGLPHFCVLIEDGDRIAVFIHGPIEVVAVMQGRRFDFALTEADGWMEDSLQGKVVRLTVSDRPLKVAATAFFDLGRGIVPGGALELVSAAAEAEPAAPPLRRKEASGLAVSAPKAVPATTQAPEPAPAEVPVANAEISAEPPVMSPIVPIPVAETAAPTAAVPSPGETVMIPPIQALSEVAAGIAPVAETDDGQRTMGAIPTPGGPVCGNGHANEPGATTCWICGLALHAAAATGEPVMLGRLVSKDMTVIVDRGLLIGRKPDDAPEVREGRLAPVQVPPDSAAVSRVHAEVQVDGWSAFIVDRGSANGTFIRPPGTSEWIKLEPGHAVKIVPGVGISIGPYEFSFEPA